MKKLLFVLCLGLVFSSCGPNREEIKEEGPNREEIKEEERMRMEAREELEEEKRLKEEKNSSTIKIGNLEVMTEDLGRMTWDDAKEACANLGDGWRLPTKDELNILYENKHKIVIFAYKNRPIRRLFIKSKKILNNHHSNTIFNKSMEQDF